MELEKAREKKEGKRRERKGKGKGKGTVARAIALMFPISFGNFRRRLARELTGRLTSLLI